MSTLRASGLQSKCEVVIKIFGNLMVATCKVAYDDDNFDDDDNDNNNNESKMGFPRVP